MLNIKSLLFILITGLFKINAVNNDIIKIYYKKEAFQGENIYFASTKNFKKLSLLGTNQKPILSASPFKFNVGKREYHIAIIGVTPMIKEGKKKIKIEFANKEYIKEIEIKKFAFKKTTVKLNKTKSKLIKSQQSPKAKEQALTLWNIIGNIGDTTIYHYDTLVHPIKDQYKITSPYGDQRIYMQDNKKISNHKMHNGKDYAPLKREKTPIFAAGRGKVVFARNREITGKTVIIQHLPGVFTIYLHLSKFGVKEHKIVNTGEYIGHVGNTGISTGPHLHFEVRINGVAVNPDFFLEQMLIDKNQIINNTKRIE
ncbi:M23 family metallopeptidase [Borrelia hermsii]|uniref:Peptidoglycan-specific endopeptidase, M23 family n=3 Tax=Borrelia hermsii TaxID=140 RepID=A0AAN0X5N6_BORHE|nr:M23 family metallopeptidase [Borrelia hermsii]AAX16772.1 cell wall endopeptidase, family M23/M37 [Borrelia hermsii DAH]AJW73072.1 peptidase M23 [Borrelia hermsii CC1]AMR75573.1 Peptidoglycan-specific endopeptidase, M23 family [Borrelia hermsii]ANA43071.1 peptidase M23 [Borrelia hermsii HS1]UCP01284.1 M23 family metallopeptidase [Borrelia hermsii]